MISMVFCEPNSGMLTDTSLRAGDFVILPVPVRLSVVGVPPDPDAVKVMARLSAMEYVASFRFALLALLRMSVAVGVVLKAPRAKATAEMSNASATTAAMAAMPKLRALLLPPLLPPLPGVTGIAGGMGGVPAALNSGVVGASPMLGVPLYGGGTSPMEGVVGFSSLLGFGRSSCCMISSRSFC